MKKQDKNNKQTLNPKEAAKDFIRPYFLDGDTLSLHPSLKLSIKTEDYSARIKGEQVLVSKLYGVEINESFPVDEILEELLKEFQKSIKERNAKESYDGLMKEIKS